MRTRNGDPTPAMSGAPGRSWTTAAAVRRCASTRSSPSTTRHAPTAGCRTQAGLRTPASGKASARTVRSCRAVPSATRHGSRFAHRLERDGPRVCTPWTCRSPPRARYRSRRIEVIVDNRPATSGIRADHGSRGHAHAPPARCVRPAPRRWRAGCNPTSTTKGSTSSLDAAPRRPRTSSQSEMPRPSCRLAPSQLVVVDRGTGEVERVVAGRNDVRIKAARVGDRALRQRCRLVSGTIAHAGGFASDASHCVRRER